MPIPEITVVTACDPKYLERLTWSLRTWREVKGITWPVVVFVNGLDGANTKATSAVQQLTKWHNVSLVEWNPPGAETQRERMLSAFILGVAEHITTPWHLKLDADTIATNDEPWHEESWFNDYDLISNGWGYTKPGHWIERVDWWMCGLALAGKIPHKDGRDKYWNGQKNEKGKKIKVARPYVGKPEDYELHGDPANPNRLKHKSRRIISWLKFMKTDIAREIADNLPLGRMPVASEDTLTWRWCHNLGKRIKRHRFKHHGWAHTKHCIAGAKEVLGD